MTQNGGFFKREVQMQIHMQMQSKETGSLFSLLVGYDGSECSRAAIDSLGSAGLPATGSATVMSVSDSGALACTLGYGYPVINPEEINLRIQLLKECAEKSAAEGAARLRQVMHGWQVNPHVAEGSPYWSLIEYAERHRVNLVAVGSHGRSAIGRALLGSTSQFLATHATCSVRICRCSSVRHAGSWRSPRLLLALDGSESSDAVVDEVARRTWPAGSSAQLVVAVDVGTAVAIRSRAAREPREVASPLPEGVLERAAAALEKTGLQMSGELKEGDPKHVILERSEFWESDTIFIGAQGHSRLSRILLGSVSASIAARASCSVEIVRPVATSVTKPKAMTDMRSNQFSAVGG